MKKQSSSSSPMRAFTLHLEEQPGIDSELTNHRLIDALFDRFEKRGRQQRHAITSLQCGRASGVTTTLIEWAKWINVPVLAIASHRDPWKHAGIDSRSWLSPIKGIRPRPEFVLIDNPVTRNVFASAWMTAKFENWLRRLPYPAFYADQLVVDFA